MVYTFYLKNIYDTTEINEPRGWKDIMNVLDRDFDVHGVFFEYTDGSLKLGFACEGKEILEEEYDLRGVEGEYQFLVDEDGVNIFTGDIDFDTRDYNEDFIEFEVDNVTEEKKLKNRAKEKINLNAQQSLDGDTLGKMNPFDGIISLATKQYRQLITRNTGETLDTQRSLVASGQTYVYANLGFTDIDADEYKKFNNNASTTSDEEIIEYFLTQETKGALAFEFDYDIDVAVTGVQGSGTTSWNLNIQLIADKTTFTSPNNTKWVAGSARQIASATIGGAAYPNNGTLSASGTTTLYYTSDPGTPWYIRCEVRMTTTGNAEFDADITINQFDLTLTDKSANEGTNADWYQVHEALNKNLAFITGKQDYLYSTLLGGELQGYNTDGCLSEMYITNGFRTRQITDTKKAPSYSFKDYVNSLNVMNAVGYGIEELDSPTDLGIHDLYWVEISGGTAEARILGIDLTSDIAVSSKISFYNNETIYGTYVISGVSYVSTYTRIFFDVSTNDQYYDNILGDNPDAGATYFDVAITCDENTSFRDRLRLENWEHFYSDNELIDLGTVQEYSEQPFTDAIYNALRIGFKKYSDDEDRADTLDEFHTRSGWSLPIVNSDNSLDLEMSWIGSSALFNESRDRLFSLKPTTSHNLDNDIFFCEKTPLQGYDTVDFNAITDEITFSAAMYDNIISAGIFLTVSGATDGGNNKQYTIDTNTPIKHDVENDEYTVHMLTSVAVTRASDTVFISMLFTTKNFYKQESDDNILTSSGLERPSYFMNQRRTMKRFIFRWGAFINSTLAYIISVSKTIRNLFYVNNGDFTTEIDSYYLDSDCVNVFGSVQEDANVETDDLDAPKFKPNLIMCTVKICDTDYDTIKDAHKNRLQSPDNLKNYGYFSVTSPNGEAKTGWLKNIKRSPVDRIAKITLIERA